MTNKLYLRAWDGKNMYYLDKCISFHFINGECEEIDKDMPLLIISPKTGLDVEIDNPEHIMQGFDWFGKVLYENDIIKSYSGTGKIIRNDFNSSFIVEWFSTIFDDYKSWIPFRGIKDMKVIGNTFENPDLVSK